MCLSALLIKQIKKNTDSSFRIISNFPIPYDSAYNKNDTTYFFKSHTYIGKSITKTKINFAMKKIH